MPLLPLEVPLWIWVTIVRWVIIGSAIVLIIISLILAWKFKEKAEVAVKEYAEKKGFTYLGDLTVTMQALLKNTPLARGGSEKALYGVKHGPGKDAMTTCLWTFVVNHGKYTETFWYIVAIKPIRFRTHGWIIMRKEDLGDKVKSALGKNDLDFENMEFSDYFYVNASPEKFGYQFFHPRMIEHFLQNREYGMFVNYDSTLIYKRVWKPDIFKLIKYIRSGFTPMVDWMEAVKVAMREVEELIPGYLTYIEARNLEEEDELAKVADGEDALEVECPDCSQRFKVAKSAKKLRCPMCGTEGEV